MVCLPFWDLEKGGDVVPVAVVAVAPNHPYFLAKKLVKLIRYFAFSQILDLTYFLLAHHTTPPLFLLPLAIPNI